MTTSDTPMIVPERFQAEVRDALLHLFDATYLQTHPLARLLGAQSTKGPSLRGKLLFRMLLDCIEALHPSTGTNAKSSSLRSHDLLELRYIEGLSTAEVMRRLSISKTQYQREHARGLAAVASVLLERLQSERAVESSVPDSSSRESLAFTEAKVIASGTSLECIDLGEMLSDLVALLQRACEDNHTEISLASQPGLPFVHSDRAILRQAFLGVLNNALEYSRNGGVSIAIDDRGPTVEAAISATSNAGAVGGAESAQHASLEIGVVRQILVAVGGTLEVEPVDQGGRWTARVLLPATRRSLLLVLDNHADFIQLVARYLTEYDWSVIGARDVSEAAALALSHLPNVILLDLMMPGQDGWDLLVSLKARPETKDIPVIICSVLYEPRIATALGAAGYLAKPLKQEALLDALAPWHQGRRGLTPVC